MQYRIAVIGATGNVGHATLQLLAERAFPLSQVRAVASDRSAGTKLSFGEDHSLTVEPLSQFNFEETDLCFFCTDSKVSAQYIPQALKAGCKVIDKSSHFRLQDNVPLIVPEVNGQYLQQLDHQLVANPNCVAVPLSLVLGPLHNAAGIKRVVLSTYQSASGAGKEGMDELYQQTRAVFVNESLEATVFPRQIAFNIFPHIDNFNTDGFTGEETKIMAEIRKIVAPEIRIVATCVRVPVFIGHSMSVNLELERSLTLQEIRVLLSKSASVLVVDRPQEEIYVTPLDVVGEDVAVVSRIRTDPTVDNGIALWISCDNLRKGAALNAVQIAEQWLDVKHQVTR